MSRSGGPNGRALVLNVTFEPISVVSQRRALVLMLADKADCVHETDHVVHSEHLALSMPSVVRLRYFVKVPFERRAPLHRKALFVRDGHRCQYCGAPADGIDHVVPRSRGGSHAWENVVACCRPCNIVKGDRLLDQLPSMRLNRPPRAPAAMSWVAMSVPRVPEEWATYLPDGLLETA